MYASRRSGAEGFFFIPKLASQTPASTKEAYLESATGSATTFSVTAKSPSGDTFTISRNASGEVSRTCTQVEGSKGCPTPDW